WVCIQPAVCMNSRPVCGNSTSLTIRCARTSSVSITGLIDLHPVARDADYATGESGGRTCGFGRLPASGLDAAGIATQADRFNPIDVSACAGDRRPVLKAHKTTHLYLFDGPTMPHHSPITVAQPGCQAKLRSMSGESR